MPAVKPIVKLLQHTSNPEQTVAVAAKLCYSDATIQELAEGLTEESTAKFIKRLASMGHASPVEHASFTFGIEGVSRAFLAQITRHRIASFSVKSQRYVSATDKFNYLIPPAIAELGDEAVAEFEKQMDVMRGWYADLWITWNWQRVCRRRPAREASNVIQHPRWWSTKWSATVV